MLLPHLQDGVVISNKVYCAAMSMMTSQILKCVNYTKTQKSRYLKNETLFFLQIKNHTHVKKVGHTSEFLFGIY